MASALPTPTLSSFLDEVRQYLRDFPDLNRLLDAEQHSDRQIRWYVAEVLDDFATSPPLIGFIPLEAVPRSLILKGVIAEALRSAAVLNLRNALRYTDGQIQVDLDKHKDLLNLSQIFWQEYEAKKQRWKVARNLDMALGGVVGAHSEYYYIAGYYFGDTLG